MEILGEADERELTRNTDFGGRRNQTLRPILACDGYVGQT
jgi:hypothetical protein